MPDNKKNTGKQDRVRVDSKDSSEVEYLHSKFPKMSHQAISGAVRAAGPLRKDIVSYLNNKGKK